MIGRLLATLRSPVVKGLFLVVAVGLGAWAVAANRSGIADALGSLPWWSLVVSGVAGAGFVWSTMLSWRHVLADLGSPVRLGVATQLFGVSQLGKYIPGGVWNLVAAAEIGADHQIPRRRSVTAMAIAVLVSLVSGLALGSVAFGVAPASDLGRWWWVMLVAPPLVVALAPPVMNRLITVALRLARRPALEHPLSARGLGVATAWALAAWLLAGLHVWTLVVALGAPASPSSWLFSTTGYALAWTAGFLFVVSPAGVGVREAVLAATLAGTGVDTPVVLTVVLLSRFTLTLVDFLLAGVGLAAARRASIRDPEKKDTTP